MTRIRDIATEKTTLAVDDDFVGDPQSGATFKMKASALAAQVSALLGLPGLLDAKAPVNHNHSLSLLADTAITTPNVGDLVQWNGSKWVAAAQSSAGSQRNRVLNSAMRISQDVGSSPVTNSGWPVDGWQIANVSDATIAAAQVTQDSPRTPGGSPNRLRVTVSVADAAIAAGQLAFLVQQLEGNEVVDLSFGNASAKNVVISFGVKAPAGTYCVALRNGNTANRAWIGEYTITAGQANVDTQKTLTLVADTTGTWATDTTGAIALSFALAIGSTYQGVAGWQAGNLLGTVNQFNFLGSTSNVFELFDVALYPGVIAPAYEMPSYEFMLERCMRRYQKHAFIMAGYATTGLLIDHNDFLPVQMRATPAVSFLSPTYGNASGLVNNTTNTDQLNLNATVTATGRGSVSGTVVLDSRI